MKIVSLGSALLLALGLLVSGGSAVADEWDVAKPGSTGRGKHITLTVVRDKADGLPLARVTTRTLNEWKDKQVELQTRFDTKMTLGPDTGKGESQIDMAVEFGSLSVDGDEMGPRIRSAGLTISVRSTLNADGAVGNGKTRGAEQLGSVGVFLAPVGSWLLPFLPAKPVKVGEAWDVPIPYFLWSIGQLGGVRAKGFVRQVFEAVEERDGVRCARIRTVVSLTRPQPKGMTPPQVGIGTEAALARFRATGMTWLGLDGCVRHDRLDVQMQIENTKTKATMDWTLHRDIVAQPQSQGALPKDWIRLMGSGPFVHGYKDGLAEGKLAGRALACFVGKYGDSNAEQLAAMTFGSPTIRKRFAAYVPVLIDPDKLGDFPQAELAKLTPGFFFLDTDGETIFQILGMGIPPEVLESMTDIPAKRAPEPKPTDAYRALETLAETMRSAHEAKDIPGALAAIAALRKDGRAYALQAEAAQIAQELATEGRERLDAARAQSAKKTQRAAARKALAAVMKDYAGHKLEQLARETDAAIPGKK